MTKKIKSKKKSKVNKQLARGAKKPVKAISGLFKAIIQLPKKAVVFLKSVRNELKLVNWLSRKQTAKWSGAVLLTALATGGFIALLDFIFYNLRNLLFSVNV